MVPAPAPPSGAAVAPVLRNAPGHRDGTSTRHPEGKSRPPLLAATTQDTRAEHSAHDRHPHAVLITREIPRFRRKLCAPNCGPYTGAVVRIARITDCHQDPDGAPLCSPWAHPSAWHLELADVQELPLPVPARGISGRGSRQPTC